MSQVVSAGDIRIAAMDLLARREHSRKELHIKLQRRFALVEDFDIANGDIENELDELAADNLQSDARFAEAFVRQRTQRGYGPQRIRLDMRDKGLSDDLLSRYLYPRRAFNWLELARAAREKKFGLTRAEDYRAEVKQMRFLQYRGFDSDTVRRAVKCDD
jgi:regulatory protein